MKTSYFNLASFLYVSLVMLTGCNPAAPPHQPSKKPTRTDGGYAGYLRLELDLDPKPGRYQITTSTGKLFLLDTAFGDLWEMSNDNAWRKLATVFIQKFDDPEYNLTHHSLGLRLDKNPKLGRYQITTSTGELMLLDTAVGDLWAMSNDDTWRKITTPLNPKDDSLVHTSRGAYAELHESQRRTLDLFPEPGRYQISAFTGELSLVDTAFGDLWAMSNDSTWRKLSNPLGQKENKP